MTRSGVACACIVLSTAISAHSQPSAADDLQRYAEAKALMRAGRHEEAARTLQKALGEAIERGDDYFAFFFARDKANGSLIALIKHLTSKDYDLMSGVSPVGVGAEIRFMVPRQLWSEGMILESEARTTKAIECLKVAERYLDSIGVWPK